MGQYFELINLDNPLPIGTSVGGKFGEFFWELDDGEVMEALSQTDKSYKVVTIEPFSELQRPEKPFHIFDRRMVFPEESLANAALPTELIIIILEEVEDLTDLVCVVLTCRRYFEIGRPILEARFEEMFTYSWAGNRLICAGDYADIDDLPEGMLTEDEKRLLDEKFEPGSTDEDCGVCEQLSFVQTLQPDWRLNHKRAIFYQDNPRLSSYFMCLQETGYHERVRTPPRVGWAGMRDVEVLKWLTKVTSQGFSDRTPLSEKYGSYVLRNLTTKEYIRGAAVREAWNTPDMPYLQALRFTHLLVLRITWSQDSSLSIPYEGPIQVHRGVWAGHRFDLSDITTVEDGQGTINNWKDVSKVVIDELMAVFEGEAEDLIERLSYWY
ncbi:hypothetical protein FPV67DRAFT_1785724 [Lyophyllum atratum]|nr:hypothetical protein FPV67DRAFT_1785724 [Lyophyllum atratum]